MRKRVEHHIGKYHRTLIWNACGIKHLQLAAVNDRYRASSDHLHIAIRTHNCCRVFIDPQAHQLRIQHNGIEETTEPFTLMEMLIDDE